MRSCIPLAVRDGSDAVLFRGGQLIVDQICHWLRSYLPRFRGKLQWKAHTAVNMVPKDGLEPSRF